MAIEGLQDVLLIFRFRCPPGIPPEKVAAEIAHGGASVSCGLAVYLKEMECKVVPPKDVQGEQSRLTIIGGQ